MKATVTPGSKRFNRNSWPDFCNGSFTQYCDFSRQFDPNPSPSTTNGETVPPYKGPGIDTFIKAFGRFDLLDFMNTFWINQGDTNARFWAHEFSKHATCFSTYDVNCYNPYVLHEDVIDFFEVRLFISSAIANRFSKYDR
jgi:ribonuclease T2